MQSNDAEHQSTDCTDDSARAENEHSQRQLPGDLPPADSEGPGQPTVWVVAANYADDPHPHIEGVYADEEAAREHEQAITDSISPSAPVAWWVYEQPVRQEVADELY